MTVLKPETETIEDCAHGDDCPLHTDNPPFNAKVLAAVAESRAIMRGDIPALGTGYSSNEYSTTPSAGRLEG